MGVLVGAIDQGTSSSRFLVFDPRDESNVVVQEQMEFESIYPKEGWAEQDPKVLVDTVKECIRRAHKKLSESGRSESLSAVGITNQRETTVVWDRKTGTPLHNAVVWLDARTRETVEQLEKRDKKCGKDALRDRCGLPISTYFSAVKLRWLLDNVDAVKKAYDEGRLCFGTVDTWLLWNLTSGHAEKGRLLTDVTNASRTMLMNLDTLDWDDRLLKFFGLEKDKVHLPVICSSSEVFGLLDYKGSPFPKVPVSGVLGDQQAALVGQHCLRPGMAKNTYGTGCFMLYNVGEKVVPSKHGMLSTVAYQMGKDAKPVYALEGSIAIAGAAVAWLRDSMGFVSKSSEIEKLAAKVEDTGGVHFVPALSGLFAPHWRADARGCISGLTQFSTKSHIARAALEAVCFQTREILDAMREDSGLDLRQLLVDGGMSENNLMMQIQADYLAIEVLRPSSVETTSLGAAIAAGRAVGKWDLSDAEKEKDCERKFEPKMEEEEREAKFAGWKRAVAMVLMEQ